MPTRRVSLLVMSLTLIALFLAVTAPEAWAKKKKHKSHPPQQQLPTPPSYEQNPAIAQAHATMAQVNDQIRTAQQEVGDATSALHKIENDLINAQSPDSDFGKARDAYNAAKAKYEASLKNTDDDDATETAKAVAKAAYEAAKDVYDKEKKKLFEADKDWTAASDDLRDKQKTLDDLNRQFSAASGTALETGLNNPVVQVPGKSSSKKSGSSNY